jgi:glucose/arabinose dehydrogenase
MKRFFTFFLLFGFIGFVASCNMMRKASRIQTKDMFTPERTLNAADIQVPDGYEVELVSSGLTFPSAAAFDDEGNLHVVEAGYSYGPEFETSRLLCVNDDGSLTEIFEGERKGPLTGVVFHEGHFFLAEGGREEGGRIVKVSKDGENVQTLVDGLPKFGDHHTNGPAIGPDGWVYFAQGTVTNSGVVGRDNWILGWLTENEEHHDIPCEDIILTGHNYTTSDPFSVAPGDTAATGPFKPFGQQAEAGEVIVGQVPCGGAVMRVRPEGGAVEVVAWGFRNPFGLAFGPDGQLYATENGFDTRGSRPVVGSQDHLWRVEPGRWYGWPDYSGGIRLDDSSFVRNGEEPIKMLLKQHPENPPKPVAFLGVHSSSNGLAFSPANGNFGFEGQAFIAQFGDQSPITGKTISPVGFKVVRVDLQSGEMQGFATNKKPGPATATPGSGGLERPVNVVFSPEGNALYVIDFGILYVPPTGPKPEEESGTIWRISKQ